VLTRLKGTQNRSHTYTQQSYLCHAIFWYCRAAGALTLILTSKHLSYSSLVWPLVLWRCWLGIRKSIRPVKNSVMRCWRGYLTGVRCKWLAYGPADATATPSSFASLKSRLV